MLETDSPYLLPRSLRPKPKSRRNEPMHLPEVIRVVAKLCSKTTGMLVDETTQVAKHFFQLS
jgi:TatD DNase family protein